MSEKKTLNGFSVSSTRMLDCPHCRGTETLRVDYDANGCARWGYCRSCGGDGPFTPCQECKKDPKPCQSNAHALAEERSDDSQQRVVGRPNGGET